MIYDVAVIGGGPAGLMAAGKAGEGGARVVLLEKNSRLGVKLLTTGNGRCNFTNTDLEAKEMVKKFGVNGKFLLSSFFSFSSEDAVAFFEAQGVKTKVEKGGRVFPHSDSATAILGALVNYLQTNNVEVKLKAEVKNIISTKNKIDKLILNDGSEIEAKKYIVAVGGKSYPLTGSDGSLYKLLQKLGHKIIIPRPALTPILVKEKIVSELEGLSLKNVEISGWQDGKKFVSGVGEAIFTGVGMSGPLIFDLSKSLGEKLPGQVFLKIDFAPDYDLVGLDLKLQRLFEDNAIKDFGNIFGDFLAPKLLPTLAYSTGISLDQKAGSVSREQRKKMIAFLKDFKLELKSLASFDKAMVTAGGVDIHEVDPKTMQSKIVENLYFAGEVLDVDGPTGGFNLQACWSTGQLAGQA